MALTLTASPPAFSSFQSDLVYTVSDSAKVSDPTDFPNFKFIADVYVGGVLQARVKKIPDPSSGIGIFNVGPILRSFAAIAFDPAAGAIVAQELADGEVFLDVQIHFGEEWNFTPTYNILIDSDRDFFNCYNGRLKGLVSSISGVQNKIASNRPLIGGQVLFSSEYFLVPYFATGTAAVSVVVTPSGGGVPFTTSFTPDVAGAMDVLNLAPQALIAVHPGSITAATKSYTVEIGGQTIEIDIICEVQHTPFMVHFLNQYGGFDSKLFTKVSRSTVTVTKTDFGKLPYTVGDDGSVSYKTGNGVYNESRSVYSSLYQEKKQLNTDILTDSEYQWLNDLIISPMIYVEDGGYLYCISITDTDYEAKKVVNDDLTNLTINIQFGEQANAQFR